MLVLTRKVGERIIIGNGIVVTVTAVHRSQVRIGIEAPRVMPVLRGELIANQAPPDASGTTSVVPAARTGGKPS
jgi:carbon storage regulator CsrA